MLPHVGDAWFRITDRLESSVVDADREEYATHVNVFLHLYYVQKVTPKGVWLSPGKMVKTRFVLLSARKRWACPTLEQALESFLQRKRRQASIYRARAQTADRAAKIAQSRIRNWQRTYEHV